MKRITALALALALVLAALPAPAEYGFVAVGSIVTYGHYEQDGQAANGAEPIQWIVLDVSGGSALLLSRYVLDAAPYHTGAGKVGWGACTLNGWLNYTFLNTAFTPQEQMVLGSITTEKVFLLSQEEAQRYVSSADLYGIPTAYAVRRGVYVDAGSSRSWWWLRSTGTRDNQAWGINSSGAFNEFHMRKESGGIRPAIRVSIGSLY